MSRNPLLNALAAVLYILTVALTMTFVSQNVPGPDTFMAPVVAMCIFTLSAAVMGYVFCYTPIQLFADGKKKQGVQLFMQTVAVFGCITLVVLGLLMAGAFQK